MLTIEIIIIANQALKNTAFGSLQTCKNVYTSLLTHYPDIKMTLCTNELDLLAVVQRRPNIVILTNKIMLNNNGEKIWLSEYFEKHNIIYTGSSKKVLLYDVNKISSKLQMLKCGVKTARFFTASPHQYLTSEEMPIVFPLFVKPNSSANSDGIDNNSFVSDFPSFQTKVQELYDIYQEPILIEEYLPGREFTVSIINAEIMQIAPIEIIAPLIGGVRILSDKIKSDDSESLEKITDSNVYQKVSEIALLAFKALGVRDFGRIDIKMNAQEECHFMEANLTPGMTEGSGYFPESYALDSSLCYDEVLHLITHSAITRYRSSKAETNKNNYSTNVEI